MHFTIVFDAHEGYDLTAGLVFKPAPVWVSGGEDVMVPRSDGAAYRLGGVRACSTTPPCSGSSPWSRTTSSWSYTRADTASSATWTRWSRTSQPRASPSPRRPAEPAS